MFKALIKNFQKTHKKAMDPILTPFTFLLYPSGCSVLAEECVCCLSKTTDATVLTSTCGWKYLEPAGYTDSGPSRGENTACILYVLEGPQRNEPAC